MEPVKLKATPRDQFGKGPSRRSRASGTIPAVFYGKGIDTVALFVSPKELSEAIASEYGPNRVLELDLGDKGTHRALLAEHQHHPVTRKWIHADFRKVDDQTKVLVQVPLKLVGKAKGIVMGGTLRQVFRTLPVRCLPGDIPASIEHDVTPLGVEETVSVGDLKLPSGVEVTWPAAQTVGGVYGSRKKADDQEGEEGKAEEAEKK